MIGDGSSVPVSKKKGKAALNELRLHSTPILLMMAERANNEVSRQALVILKERGLDERSSKETWAYAWRSTNALSEQDLLDAGVIH
jgi:hypothetical protein